MRQFLYQLRILLLFFCLAPQQIAYIIRVKRSHFFDPKFYRDTQAMGFWLFRLFPIWHYVRLGEAAGLKPNENFCPRSYLQLNPDVADQNCAPLWHYIHAGYHENRQGMASELETLPIINSEPISAYSVKRQSPIAVAVHVFYPEIWSEISDQLQKVDLCFDLYVTVTWRGEESSRLRAEILNEFAGASIYFVPNRGRDILPFLTLVNAGLFAGYDAVAKIHTKKSQHRVDGDDWRRALIRGILPEHRLREKLSSFLRDPEAMVWVADGQQYRGSKWWGANRENLHELLARVELDVDKRLQFPAGSIYWLKPLMVNMFKALELTASDFIDERGQLDGTMAHAFERAVDMIAKAAGGKVLETSEIGKNPQEALPRPRYTSAFYLPQFHKCDENDRFWGEGYSEWRAAVSARPKFNGHLQPILPRDLGFYDLRLTQTMSDQWELAKQAGINGFCVYHYWFDPNQVLAKPMQNLLGAPDVDFPFYLCWANEAWRRNWDGLSGEILVDQPYRDGFEERLVASTLPYMRDRRYQRPDGKRPRFVIYRPGDMPNPSTNIEKMRQSWRAQGIGEVELGAVHFHVEDRSYVAPDLVDFWIEMPPHGLVQPVDFVHGSATGSQLEQLNVKPDFEGLVYSYPKISRRAVSEEYASKLPKNTIAGIMPSWDNTARRGNLSHIARGANPATFRRWLRDLSRARLASSYNGELFINAWNEWGEKAMLEPSERFGMTNLDVIREICNGTSLPQLDHDQLVTTAQSLPNFQKIA